MYASQGQPARTDLGYPDEGPFRYTILPEPFLTHELTRLASAKSTLLSRPSADVRQAKVDSVTFQPCLVEEESSQDRLVLEDWEDQGALIAVFDGHAGHECADYAKDTLPGMVRASLAQTSSPSPFQTASLLANAITSIDERIKDDIISLFPGGESGLDQMSLNEVRHIVNDQDYGGTNHEKVIRGMRGSTALLSLLDSTRENLWVANLGDCQAILGTKLPSGEWKTTLLSSCHNGDNEREVQRVRDEHPGERQCILNQRVLGALAVTRALGDHSFKLPPLYTHKVFLNSNPGFRVAAKVQEFIARSHTPPYVSSTPEVCHRALESGDRFLILCSDGLKDLWHDYGANSGASAGAGAGNGNGSSVEEEWVKIVGKVMDEDTEENTNFALTLLRESLGGDDPEKVSRMVTVEMGERWMDDTTIQVVTF
ncbi:hypothetical protein BOTBODRAFT_153711 [Botryobasidium botryosum FD-172 SS1]|uniref:PPM-type phosphatase domain-containing protein n=1 Tax=Botryobasidium botryosum (strain FD-172 SS1) TaxID=930990 RepID=A0A067N400_BOTB1|nr:hypothetical protein BOTBODRAFT_153711 [Botryobasidium botryosum FD-172 SS1]